MNDESQRSSPLPVRILTWLVAIILVGLYVYAVVAAVGNWIGIAGYAEALAGGLSAAGVAWLTLGVAIPVVALIVSILVGRKRSGSMRILILLLGLSLTAAMQLNIMHVIPTTSYFDQSRTVGVLE